MLARSIGAGVTSLPPTLLNSAPLKTPPVISASQSKSKSKKKKVLQVRSTDYGGEEDDDDDDDDEADDLEAELLNEKGSSFCGVGVNASGGKINLSQRMTNDLTQAENHGKHVNHTGRDDRATSEQVMDPRTRLMLFKLLNSGFMSEIDGCLSTGKEANVYYARAGPKGTAMVARNGGSGIEEFAVKVFKTSILVFKDRDK
jgi:hypothetical protein